jgi:hypothetical protein
MITRRRFTASLVTLHSQNPASTDEMQHPDRVFDVTLTAGALVVHWEKKPVAFISGNNLNAIAPDRNAT